jgi:uncharacterized protein YcsI (UPF0317 family)
VRSAQGRRRDESRRHRDGRSDVRPQQPLAVRHAARHGILTSQTSGCADGFVQVNLAILPRAFATEFLTFCQRNPKPCPLLAMSEAGEPGLPGLAADLDVRTDVPGYRVWRDGELVGELPDIRDLWRDDLVAFAIGCSFSFEAAMLEAGLPIRHLERNETVPMYVTSIETQPAGPFHGPMVVSMRPFRPADAIRAVEISARFPAVHGAPVHIGHPHLIGIGDITRPDFGPERALVEADELPLFWACGVTPQMAIQAARPPICITHAPGHMLVTDLRNASLVGIGS